MAGIMIIFANVVYAASWVSINSEQGEENYISLESIQIEGDLVYYQKKTVIKDENNGYKKIYGAKAYATYTQNIENCRSQTTKVLKIILQDSQGKNLMAMTTPSDVDFVSVPEAGDIKRIHDFACKQQQSIK